MLRIHDLMEANAEQETFYRSLIAKYRVHVDGSSSLSSCSEASSDHASVHQLESSLQTAREDIEMLQRANGARISPV